MVAVTPDATRLAVALGAFAGFGAGGVLVPTARIAITVTPDTSIATCVALSFVHQDDWRLHWICYLLQRLHQQAHTKASNLRR
jgi:hypothetical protein